MKLEVLNENQRQTLSDMEGWVKSDSMSIAMAVRWGPELLPIISDLTDRLASEQLRRESAEKVVDAAYLIEEHMMLKHPEDAKDQEGLAHAHRKLYPKDSKDINNG